MLARLLEHPSTDTFDITVLVRDANKAQILESQFGVNAVVGTHQDLDKIESLVENAHAVFHLVSRRLITDYAWHIRIFSPVHLAARPGRHRAHQCHLERYAQATRRAWRSPHPNPHCKLVASSAVWLSTLTYADQNTPLWQSETSVLADDARGMYITDTVYDDLNVQQMKSLRPTAHPRPVDLLITEADTQGYLRAHIVLPLLIYGVASQALVRAGVSHSTSIQIPTLIRAALDRGQAGMIGQGKSLWPDVHIDDSECPPSSLQLAQPAQSFGNVSLISGCVHTVANLYVLIFDTAVRDPEAAGHDWEGFYLGESGEHTWYLVSKVIGYVLVGHGISNDPEQTGVQGWGSNSRARGRRARAIGWEPTHTAEDMQTSIPPEVEALVKQRRETLWRHRCGTS